MILKRILLCTHLKGTEMNMSYPMVHIMNVHRSQAEPGRIEEPGIESGSSTWMTGTQPFVPLPVASQGLHHEGAEIRSRSKTKVWSLQM